MMAVIALLLIILIPAVKPAFEVAYKTRCLNNLAKIGQALHSGHTEGTSLPTPETWVDAAAASASKEVLRCDKDTTKRSDPFAGTFQDVYLLQYNYNAPTTDYDVSFLINALASGTSVPDPQLRVWYPKAGIDTLQSGWKTRGYVPTALASNQAFVAVGDATRLSCGVLITFGARIEFESWPNGGGGGSRHWLMQGKGTPRCPLPRNDSVAADIDDKQLLWLASPDASPPYFPTDHQKAWLGGQVEASYGMNRMVDSQNYSLRQLLVMDANETIIRVGTTNNEDADAFSSGPEGVIRARHLGKVNVLTCDGSVTSWTLQDLRAEYDKEGRGRWNSQ
jgi:prepilin-type processing-associated H-X9-DG protein